MAHPASRLMAQFATTKGRAILFGTLAATTAFGASTFAPNAFGAKDDKNKPMQPPNIPMNGPSPKAFGFGFGDHRYQSFNPSAKAIEIGIGLIQRWTSGF